MLDALLSGFVLLFQWPALGYLGLGIALGLYFGAVPGLSGLVGMAILLPFTFGMEPISAFAFLLGMYAVTTTSDTIASVMLGIPGTAASQATILDGYPMAMRGEAARALGAAFTVSAVGGVLGALVLAASIPLVRPLILSFASPEYFMLGVLGLTMAGALSGNSILKGVAAALFGLLLSTIGYADQVAIPRYFFGVTYLLDGLPLIPRCSTCRGVARRSRESPMKIHRAASFAARAMRWCTSGLCCAARCWVCISACCRDSAERLSIGWLMVTPFKARATNRASGRAMYAASSRPRPRTTL
jgi:TctA family transporter